MSAVRLFFEWIRRVLGLSKPERIPIPSLYPTSEMRSAVHESGHATAAWFCSYVEEIHTAYIDTTGGAVRYVIGGPVEARAWCGVVLSLAGVAAEARLFKSWRSKNAEDDLLHARECAKKTNGAPPPWKSRKATKQALETAYKDPLSDEESAVIRQGYQMAKELVAYHAKHLYRCTGLLLDRRHLTEKDLETVFGTRSIFRVITRQAFWMPSR